MNRAATLLCTIAFVSLLSQFGKTIFGLIGVPNIIPVIRDLLLVALTTIALSRSSIFKSQYFFGAALVCIFIVIVNTFIAMFDGLIFAGLYYARLYALPIIYAVAAHGLIVTLNASEATRLARFVYYAGFLVVLTAIGLFSAVEFSPALLGTLMGSEQGTLASAWYIAGGTWLRMGLPATGPNSLGLAVGLYLLFLIALQFSGRASEIGGKSFKPVILCALAVFLLTFSRSSWLAFIVGLFALYLSTRREWALGRIITPLSMVGFAIVGATLAMVSLLYLDAYSNGAVSRWVELNLSGSDPSMVGHGKSLVLAWDLLDKYFLLGYPRGSVGPKAILFGGGINNVENSILAVYFDMGIFLGTAMLISGGLLLRGLWLHRSQASMIAAFFIAGQLLPYSFEPDVIIFFLMIYAVTGRLMSFSVKPENFPNKYFTRSIPRNRLSTASSQPNTYCAKTRSNLR